MKAFVLKSIFYTSIFLPMLIHLSASAQPDDAAGAYSAADGAAGASSYDEPTVSSVYDTEYESQLLSGTYQLITDSLRSSVGYFSADGNRFIFQSEVPSDNPFYQIFVRDLETGATNRVSPGIGLTTCAWIHPTMDRVMFSSTHEDPDALAKQPEEMQIRRSGIEREHMVGTMTGTMISIKPIVMAAISLI